MTTIRELSKSHLERQLRQACAGKQLLVLDYDGTLAYLAIDWSAVRRDLSLAASSEGFDSDFRPLWTEIDRFRDECGADRLPLLFRALARHEEIGLDGQQPRHDVVDAVKSAIRETGADSVSLSLNLHSTVDVGLRRLGLSSVSAVVGADDVHHWKPDLEGLNQLLARADVAPAQTLVIGNSEKDAGVAAAASVDFFRV